MVRGCSVAAAADEEPDGKPGSCMLLLLLGGWSVNIDLDVVPGVCVEGGLVFEVVIGGGGALGAGGLFFGSVNFGGAALIPTAPGGRDLESS